MRGMKSVLLPVTACLCAMLAGCAAKAPANAPGALNIAQFTLAQGAIGVSYRQLLVASGGLQPYTWSISSGALPGGLSVTTDGIISGTPSSDPSQYPTTGCLPSNTPSQFPITCNFAAQVVDSQSPTHAVDTKGESITINQDLSLTSTPLATGTVGQSYNVTFMAANGVPPYSYSLAFGSLPDGLTLSTVVSMNGMANPAAIMGIPTTAGVYSFTVQATDGAGETATANFTINVVGRLTGPYAIYFNGFDTNQPAGSQAFNMVAQVVAANDMNGSGTITGVLDQNGSSPTPSGGTMITGTYNIPTTSNFGTISFTRADNSASYQFYVALSGTTSDSNLIQVDPNNKERGAGLLKKQATTNLAVGSTITYTFGMFGTDPSGNRYAGAGAFAINTSLAVTGGAEDTNDNGMLSGERFITAGSFTAPDSGTGRGTASLMVAGNPVNYVYYVVSPTELIAVASDTGAPATLLDIVQQQGVTPGSSPTLCKSGDMCQGVLELSGTATSGSNTVSEVELGVASVDGSGNFMRNDQLPPYYVDQDIAGALTSVSSSGGTYSIDSSCGPNFPHACGRVTINLQGVTNQPVWYLVSTGQAYVVGGDADVLQGTLQPQSPPMGGFTLPNLLASYLGGSITPTVPGITNELDVAGTPPPGGTWLQNYETSGPMGAQTGLSFTGSYNIDLVNVAGECNAQTGANCYGAAFGRFAICAPMTTEFCSGNTAFMFDPSHPPVSIVYIAGGAGIGATGGKTGLAGVNLGVVDPTGMTTTLDTNPRLTLLGR
jgi:hypothetical protein